MQNPHSKKISGILYASNDLVKGKKIRKQLILIEKISLNKELTDVYTPS